MSDLPSSKRFTVEPADVGVRLQQFLAKRLDLSLSQTNRLLDRGLVVVEHWTAKRKHKGYKLMVRQVIVVRDFDRPEAMRASADESLAIEIVAENAERGWVVVNKPAGVAVHPLEPGESGTVLNALIAKYPGMHGVGEGGLRSGVVHRLDMETSGTLLFATKQGAWQRLRAAFAEHRTTKIYRAIVLGRLEGGGEEKMLLHIAQHKPAKVRVVDAALPEEDRPRGTRLCDLSWSAVETFGDATLVEVNLGTGFLHQIRAMFAAMGHPVAGDGHYRPEGAEERTGAGRPMLHAGLLRVEEVDARCEEPVDFRECLTRLR
jgi:23S rRNA pseudouridine1911/1915/1917 synthase